MSKHVFLVDDDDDDCLLFSDALHQIDPAHQLSVAGDGNQAMDFLTSTHTLPDVMFLDVNMPAKNGFETLEEIMATENLNKLPVIIFSTSTSAKSIDSLFNLGARFYLSKPQDFNTLKKMIREVLESDISGKPDSKHDFLKFMQ